MKKLNISHPYFQAIVCDESQCWVTLNKQFPITGFRLAVIEPISSYIEVGSDIGFRHSDGEIDWIYGHGETVEQATEVALQNFLNLVVYPDNLTADDFVKREVIA